MFRYAGYPPDASAATWGLYTQYNSGRWNEFSVVSGVPVKRGKAYSVYSFMSTYSDTGYLGIYAGTSLEAVEEVIDLVLRELKCLAAGEIKEDEVRRTRGQLVGNIMLGLEIHD